MLRCLCLLLPSAILVMAAAPVAAQPSSEASPAEQAPPSSAQPENLEAAQHARIHFMAGIQAFQQHRYRESIRSFQLAAQLVPSADLWFNIARAHEELSEYEEAIEHYQNYLRDRVDPPDRAEVEQHIESLRERAAAARDPGVQPTSGTLRLTANYDGAEVVLDDAAVGRSPWAEPRELGVGRHRLALSREGYVPFRSEVSVEPGMTTAAYADLVPETRYRAIHNDRIFTWVAWGLGVASLGVSIGLGVEAASRQATDLNSARTWAAYSDGALGATIGFGVLGLILFFVEGRSVDTERVTVADEGTSTVRGLDGE